MDPAFGLVLRASLALLFGSALVHKLVDLPRFAAIVQDYEIGPRSWVRFFALLVPAAEGATATAFLLDSFLAPWLGFGLLTAYSVAIGVNLARGRRDIDCGCGGPGGQRIGPGLLIRNALLAVAVLLTLVPTTARSLGPLDFVTVAFTVVSLALAWSAAGRLFSLPDASSSERIPT